MCSCKFDNENYLIHGAFHVHVEYFFAAFRNFSKTASKILLLVMIFCKSRFACNYIACENLKSRYPKIAFMYLLEKTTHPKVLKLGLYLPWVNIYRFMKGFEKFYFFRILRAKNCPKMVGGGHIGFLSFQGL